MGRKHWAIAEGFIPGESNGPAPLMTSHETVCMLNTGDSDAHVEMTIYFQDRDPVGPYLVVVPAQRSKHLCASKSMIQNSPVFAACSPGIEIGV
jgi:hypothetical protein